MTNSTTFPTKKLSDFQFQTIDADALFGADSQATIDDGDTAIYAPDSERAILGVLLLDPQAAEAVANLDPAAFFAPSHREIYIAILDLRGRGVPLDPVQVGEELRARGKLDAVGGLAYVASLYDGAARVDIAGHVARVIECAEKRELQRLGDWVRKAAANGTTPAEIVRQMMDRARTVVEIGRDWPEPRPIPDGLRPVDSLPDALLPNAIHPWLADIAERLQVPLEFVAVPAIVALASVIGNQVAIRPKRHDDWEIVPNLWGAVIGRPGVMKSPAIDQSLKPLRRLVKNAEIEHLKLWAKYAFTVEASKAKKDAVRDKLKKAAKTGQDLEQFRIELEIPDDPPPVERRYLTNDATIEKYGELLNQNRNGLLMFRDELTGWLRSLDDERRANDRAFYLEAWGGAGSYVYDRIGRGTLKIDSITTSVIGGIQPGPLESYLRGAMAGGVADDGLLQRFQVMVYPDLPDEWQMVDRWPDTEAKNQAFEIFKRLSGITYHNLPDGDSKERYLRFDPDAQEFFNEWLTDHAQTLRGGEIEHPALEAHYAKYRSLIPSLALIFELIERASVGEFSLSGADAVGLPTLEKAAAWGSFLWLHAERIYGLGINAASNHARTLARKLQAGALDEGFTARDVWTKNWSGLATSDAVREPLDILESLGWLRSVEIRNPAGGRPTVQFTINPRIRGVRL